MLTDDAFEHERISSIKRQADLEKSDTISFDEYLKLHAGPNMMVWLLKTQIEKSHTKICVAE